METHDMKSDFYFSESRFLNLRRETVRSFFNQLHRITDHRQFTASEKNSDGLPE